MSAAGTTATTTAKTTHNHSPKSKPSKNSTEKPANGESSTTNTSNGEHSASVEPTQTKCVVCSLSPSSSSIVKDANYIKLLTFYWEALEIDVKPAEMAKQSLCLPCFEALVEFYDTNDVLVILEKQLRTQRTGLINATVKGIKKLQSTKQVVLPLHKKILEKWPEVKEENADSEVTDVTNGTSTGNSKPDVSVQTSLETPRAKRTESPNEKNDSSSASTVSVGRGRPRRRRSTSSSGETESTVSPPPRKLNRPTRATRTQKSYVEKDADDGEEADDSRNGNRRRETNNGKQSSDSEDADGKVKCDVCLDKFPSRMEVIKHMKDHQADKQLKQRYQCRSCRRGFSKSSDLINHKKKCTPR